MPDGCILLATVSVVSVLTTAVEELSSDLLDATNVLSVRSSEDDDEETFEMDNGERPLILDTRCILLESRREHGVEPNSITSVSLPSSSSSSSSNRSESSPSLPIINMVFFGVSAESAIMFKELFLECELRLSKP